MAKATTDHGTIRKWAEARKGRPARVKTTGKRGDPGVLRIDFPGYSGGDTLETIEWDEWLEAFDENNLAFLHESSPRSRFNKLVDRGSVSTGGRKASSKKSSSSKKAASTSSKKASSKKAGASKRSAGALTKKAGASKRTAGALSKKAGASTGKAGASTRKAAASTKKAGASTKKAGASTKKPGASTKKAGASSKKASSSKKKASGSSVTTTNRDEIRKWVEARGGFPATVSGTERRGQDAGVLRIDYPGFSGKDTLERIEWDDWFEKFDREKLAFVYQNKRGSRFSKLVAR